MFLLKELIRFSSQNRTFYCYLLLSIWIFLLVVGMYKYIGNVNNINNFLNVKPMYTSSDIEEQNMKLKKYKMHCSPVETIIRKDDGGLLDGWKLQGVLLVIRHGDRGPMSHVRGISSVNCGVENDILLNRYKIFLHNTTNISGLWNKIGPFHGFPLLPPTTKGCLLGQLTYKGIVQLLHAGELLHQVYAHPLGLLLKPQILKHNINSTPNTFFNSDEIIVYSTRYRRTFQSAMALLFTLLPLEKWVSLNVRESHSMAFCFSDCACPQIDVLRKKLSWLSSDQLSQHPAVSAVVQWIGQSLLQHSANGFNDPHEVLDAVLALVCHNHPLPCKKSAIKRSKKSSSLSSSLSSSSSSSSTSSSSSSTSITISPVATTADMNDVINIDQDESGSNDAANGVGGGAGAGTGTSTDPEDSEMNDLPVEACIETSHIAALMSYTNWQSSKETRHSYYRQIGILRAYGMIRHIVSYMLKMISGDRTKFILYSGHDWTIQYLTAAFGINTSDTPFIPYASRMAFEVYRSIDMHTDYYFRVVYNGKDVTQQIDFCEGGKSLRITRDSRGSKADLCPIENIIRFIHDDYFSSLNATNFKDACTIQKSNEF